MAASGSCGHERRIRELQTKIRKLERELDHYNELRLKEEVIKDVYKDVLDFLSRMRGYFFAWEIDDLKDS